MKTLTTLSILFVVAASAMAGGNQTSPTDIIAKVDADGDGKISKSEFTGPAEVFAKLDANGDGSITAQEIEVAQVKKTQKRLPHRQRKQPKQQKSRIVGRERLSLRNLPAARLKGIVPQPFQPYNEAPNFPTIGT